MTTAHRCRAARERAHDDARSLVVGKPDGRRRSTRLAIGDPQAPFDKFLGILGKHGLLAADGRIEPDVALVTIGDHFDWGGIPARETATRDGLELLSWLAAHPSDQVTILLGNHDLGRVGELMPFDEATFQLARSEADRAYRGGDVDRELEEQLITRYPTIPTAEVLARDFSGFTVAQRVLVETLIRTGRMELARAVERDLLLVHSSVTEDDLEAIGLSTKERNDAYAIQSAIDEHLHAAIGRWDGKSPLDLSPLHRPGDAKSGEGRGITYQRPAQPIAEEKDLFIGPPRRRFDPRTIPQNLTQVVGHIRDQKTRKLLGSWATDQPTKTGVLRSLITDGRDARYRNGTRNRRDNEGQMIFIDGSMSTAQEEDYQLFDIVARSAL